MLGLLCTIGETWSAEIDTTALDGDEHRGLNN